MKREPHHSDFYRQFEGQLSANVIRNELTAENYKEKFHHLLCWEEKEHERLLANRCVLAVLSKLQLVFQELYRCILQLMIMNYDAVLKCSAPDIIVKHIYL